MTERNDDDLQDDQIFPTRTTRTIRSKPGVSGYPVVTAPTHTDPGSPQHNVTVMASAGTGKTWLLVTRLVRLLLAGARPTGILAITFTRKAAAEMQTRLAERLYSLAIADDTVLREQFKAMGIADTLGHRDQARRLYESLLESGQSVRTTTFHAFCQEVLRRFPLEADVPPGFELSDETGELTAAARDALLAQATADPNGSLAGHLETLLQHCGGLHGLEQALGSFLDHRSDWWAFSEGENDPVAFAAQRLREQLQVSDDGDPRHTLLTMDPDASLETFRDLLVRDGTSTSQRLAEAFSVVLDPQRPDAERFEALQTVFLTQAGEPRTRRPSKAAAKRLGEAGQERLLALHEVWCARLQQCRQQLATRQNLAATIAWYCAGSTLLTHYQRIKGERRLLDFADLEWRAYRLLSGADNAHWVQYKLDQRIDHLLVDEFQDTNPTQWRLLLPLLEEMAAGSGERSRSVFLVGDAKQSIYRFRRAEPRLLDSARTWLQQRVSALDHQQHGSRRSAPAIMEAVNRIFGQGPLAAVMTDFPHHSTHLTSLWGRVQLFPLVAPQEQPESAPVDALRNPLQQPRQLVVDSRHRREGRLIAETVQRLVAEQTVIGEGTNARALRYGDIMLLVRNRNHVNDYERALREAQIPYVGADRGTLLEALEVRDMVALLEWLIAPFNDLSLAMVLRSPLFGCSDGDLLHLASGSGWYLRLRAMAGDADTAPDSPLGRAARLLPAWQQLAGHLPIHDLLDRVFCEGDVLARYEHGFPVHLRSRCRANLTRFIELALEIDAGRYPSLTHFLHRLRELREGGQEAPDEAPTNQPDRLRIMTIHAAKGLEAPIVFLADSTATQQRDRPYRTLLEWPVESAKPLGMLLVGRREQHDPYTQLRLEQERKEEQRESANLLYVALTRARQLLYISGCEPTRSEELGWYGNIRAALSPDDALQQDAPIVVESGQMAAAAAHPTAPLTPAMTLDEALSGPFSMAPQTREIAPSHRTSSSHPESVNGDEDGRRRGIAIHRCLECLCRGESAEDTYTRVAAELALASEHPELRTWFTEAYNLYTHPGLRRLFHPQPDVQAFNEVPLSYRTKHGDSVYGIIDRLLVSADTVTLVDYKTHREANQGELSALAKRYNEQMSLYAAGLRRLWPNHRLHAYLLFTAAATLWEMETPRSN